MIFMYKLPGGLVVSNEQYFLEEMFVVVARVRVAQRSLKY